jgi:hypothetical protein
MTKKVSKEMIWGAYVVLTVILGVVGYLIGMKNKNGGLYASVGVVLGAVISIILWVTVGKKMSESK